MKNPKAPSSYTEMAAKELKGANTLPSCFE
jgi:hypothetical protein